MAPIMLCTTVVAVGTSEYGTQAISAAQWPCVFTPCMAVCAFIKWHACSHAAQALELHAARVNGYLCMRVFLCAAR
jgi:hypothetical protein